MRKTFNLALLFVCVVLLLIFSINWKERPIEEWIARNDGPGSYDYHALSVVSDQEPCETLVHYFVNGASPTYTTKAYTGTVMVTIKGTGQAAGPDYSDAFYVYEDTNNDGLPPYVPYYYASQYNFALWINGMPAHLVIEIPPYESSHEYTFHLQATGAKLSFAVGDTGTHDNTGQYEIEVCQIGIKDDLLGTWPTGVWYQNSETGSWIRMTTPANLLAAGDLDGDGVADLVGVWSSGLWVKYSSSVSWKKLSNIPLPTAIACGDVNGDGRDDIVGSWPMGTFYRDTLGEIWVYISSPADALAAGDLDGDGTDDLIGVWDDGLWVKYFFSGLWEKLDKHPPDDIACGDMNGDGRDDVLGTWSVYGTFYLDTLGGSWVYMSTPAVLVGTGDLDGDGTDDLIGTWSGAYMGLWVKSSAAMSWKKISLSVPIDIDAGQFKGGVWDAGAVGYFEPIGGYAEEPGNGNFIDLSDVGPGGWNFVYQEEGNLIPQEAESQINRTPGPGEAGFSYIEQQNLVPREDLGSKKNKRK